MWGEVSHFTGMADFAATGMDLPATDGTRFGAERRKIQQRKRERWPEIKKHRKTRTHDRVHRRKRVESASASLPYIGSAGPDTCPAISFQPEDLVGHGRRHLVELLLPAFSRQHSQSAGSRGSLPSAAAHPREAAGGLGWTDQSSRSSDLGFRTRAARAH